MMNRNPDIMFMAEYLKNVLYFATVREGKTLRSCAETHYFSIDNDLVYENYYSDFGPLNLGCVYKYCKMMNEKLKQYINRQKIVHYTSIDPKKKANAAFLLGCYGVLYLNLKPKDALKPLMVHGQSYRHFQDATQGDSVFTISIIDCLNAIVKARELGFFNFEDFNYEEYNRLDKIQGGDLNWIVPGKYLAFIGPVDYCVSLYHPPEMYIDYFIQNNVKNVIRLNKRLYDGNIFINAGINHYDLFFPDGSCPPRHILMKFLQISEDSDGAIAVHCKAGLGRTGSLIGCYLIKHYRMTSHEAIGWMRICRPGSVIGHQQAWLEQLEAWLLKQGDLYRKRSFNDPGRLPYHEFGVYSIVEKTIVQRPIIFQRPVSPQLESKPTHSDVLNFITPRASRTKEAINKVKTECFNQCSVKSSRINSQRSSEGTNQNVTKLTEHRGGSACESRIKGPSSKSSTQDTYRSSSVQKSRAKFDVKDNVGFQKKPSFAYTPPITTFRTSNGPVLKSVDDARNYLLRSSKYNEKHEKKLLSPITITPRSHTLSRPINYSTTENTSKVLTNVPAAFSTSTRCPVVPSQRRRLGRSPSPQPRVNIEQTRTSNTSTPYNLNNKSQQKNSKTTLVEALSKLKLSPREDSVGRASVGAASLGARREAPRPPRAPSVRSDECPHATQGDLLNSIKFQRRLRENLTKEKLQDKISYPLNSKDKLRPQVLRVNQDSIPRDRPNSPAKNFFGPTRPSSPKGRRSPHTPLNRN